MQVPIQNLLLRGMRPVHLNRKLTFCVVTGILTAYCTGATIGIRQTPSTINLFEDIVALQLIGGITLRFKQTDYLL